MNTEEMIAKTQARAAAVEARSAQAAAKAFDPDANDDFVRACFDRNKVGDAALFREIFAGKYVFVQEWEKFLVWTGNYWEIDKRSRHALADVEKLCEVYQNSWAKRAQAPGSEDAKEDAKLLKRKLYSLRSAAGRKEVLECLATIDGAPVVSADQLDQRPYLLATPTGVVDLRTGECQPGRQEDYLTIPCPTPWQGLDAPCPTFRKFLLSCMADDQEMADFLIRLLGYALLGDKFLHIWAIMFGPLSRNGKDTCMNIVKHVLGRALHINIPVTMLTEQRNQPDSSRPQADLMALRGTRIAYASEANAKQSLDQAKIKAMTGGGYITARGLQDRDMTEWRQSALLLLLTNYMPKLSPDDDGFLARTYCIEWPVKFVENPEQDYERQIDRHILNKMEDEAPGILAALVAGAMEVTREQSLCPPEKVIAFTKAQVASFDDIGNFIDNCCIPDGRDGAAPDKRDRESVATFVEILNWWCRKELGNTYPYSPKKVAMIMEKKGYGKYRTGKARYFTGLTIKSDVIQDHQASESDGGRR